MTVLPDEPVDTYEFAVMVLGNVAEHWWAQPNSRLGGLSPRAATEAGDAELVRQVLKTILYIGIS